MAERQDVAETLFVRNLEQIAVARVLPLREE